MCWVGVGDEIHRGIGLIARSCAAIHDVFAVSIAPRHDFAVLVEGQLGRLDRGCVFVVEVSTALVLS